MTHVLDINQVLKSLTTMSQENPRAFIKLALVLSDPPDIGSMKISWRDKKVAGIETIVQTY